MIQPMKQAETADQIYQVQFGIHPRTQLSSFKRDSRTTLQEHADTVVRLANVAYGGLSEKVGKQWRLKNLLASINHVSLQWQHIHINLEMIEAAMLAGNGYLQIATPLVPLRTAVYQNVSCCERDDSTAAHPPSREEGRQSTYFSGSLPTKSKIWKLDRLPRSRW